MSPVSNHKYQQSVPQQVLSSFQFKYYALWLHSEKKADVSKGYQNPKRKLGVTMHFSKIIELTLGKKLPYILCIFALFWNYGCLIVSENCMVTHSFCFWIPITLAKIYFSPIVITFAKNTSVSGGTVLNSTTYKYYSICETFSAVGSIHARVLCRDLLHLLYDL